MLIRFLKLPNDLPNICPSSTCQSAFSLIHSDICNKGGSIFRRHDYVKNIVARHAEEAFGRHSTEIEPSIGSLDDKAKEMIQGNISNNARADIAVRGLMHNHKMTYIDICIISPVCDSNKNNSVATSISNAEKRKINDYQDRIQKQLGGDFKPFVMSSGGGVGNSAKTIIKYGKEMVFLQRK